MTYPDSVNLVNPPRTTIPNTNPDIPNNQYATLLEVLSGKNALLDLVDFSNDALAIPSCMP